MIRLLARMTLNLLSNAIGLLAAAALVDGFSINASGYISAVLIFSVSMWVLGPLIAKIALTNASFLIGGIALVTTLVSLVLTSLITDGLHISGVSAWVIATLIIWLFSVLGGVLLPLIIFRNVLKKDKNQSEAQ